MAIANSNRARKGPSRHKSIHRKEKSAPSPDLYGILGRFSDARSFLECGVRLLDCYMEESGVPGPGDEVLCLRHGLHLLQAAYRDLDGAIVAHGHRRIRASLKE